MLFSQIIACGRFSSASKSNVAVYADSRLESVYTIYSFGIRCPFFNSVERTPFRRCAEIVSVLRPPIKAIEL